MNSHQEAQEIVLLPPRLDNTQVAVWGDSMAQSLFTGLEAAFADLELSSSSLNAFNFGIRSQNSVAVAMRHGGSEWSAHLDPGNPSSAIPASADDVVSIGNFQDSILTKNLLKHSHLLESNGWSGLSADPLSYGYWPNAFPSDSSFSPFKSTHVSISGVEGVIWRNGPEWPFNTGNYVFKRKESGKPVPLANPIDVHVIGAGYDWSADNFVDIKSTMRSHNVLWPFGPAMPVNPDSNRCQFAADVERDSIQSMLDSLGSIPGGSGNTILLYSAPLNNGKTAIDCIEKNVYQESYSNIYYDFADDFKTGLPVLPPFKTWFSETYPDLYTDPQKGWEAPIESYSSVWGNFAVIPKTSAVRKVKLVDDSPDSLNPGTYEQISTQLVGTSQSSPNSKIGCKIGIEVSQAGHISSIWVHQGGVNYGTEDLLYIPRNSIGNSEPIMLSVEETRSEVIGTVYNKEGNIDDSLSYSEFDQANGYLPRSAFFDTLHLNSLGVEYLNHLLAYRLMRLSSNGSSVGLPDDVSDGDIVAFLSVDGFDYGGEILYEFTPGNDLIDDGQFLIEGNRLKAGSGLKATAGSEFLIRIRASNAIGATTENDILLSVFDADLDVEPPFPLSASTKNHELSIVFNEELVADHPSLNRFIVKQRNQRIRVKSIALDQDQKTMHLTLKSSPALEVGPITIGYRGYARDKNKRIIEDLQGNDLTSFNGFTVDNFILEYDEENFPLLDFDGNGFVDGSEKSGYQIFVDEWTAISLFTRSGKNVIFQSDLSSNDWNIVAAQSTHLGFEILVKGLVDQLGKFAAWTVELDGRIRSNTRKIDWKTISQLSAQTDWESFLSDDLDGDGLIGPPPIEDKDGNGLVDGTELTAYQLFNNEDPITLYSGSRRRQTTYNDDASPDWDVIAGVAGGKKGFQLLLEGEGQFVGEYAIWDVKTSGKIWTKLHRTKWLNDYELVSNGYEALFSYDIDGDGVMA